MMIIIIIIMIIIIITEINTRNIIVLFLRRTILYKNHTKHKKNFQNG